MRIVIKSMQATYELILHKIIIINILCFSFESSDKRYTGKASESTAVEITCHDHSMLYWDARDFILLSQLRYLPVVTTAPNLVMALLPLHTAKLVALNCQLWFVENLS